MAEEITLNPIPKKRKPARRVVKKITDSQSISQEPVKKQNKFKFPAINKKVFVASLFSLLLLSLVTLALTKYKNQFIVATIDNKIITRFDLNEKMAQRYGQTTLDNIVTFYLVKKELNDKKIVVTDEDFDKKKKEIEAGLGNQKLEDFLKQQNLNYDQVVDEIKIQIGLDKLLSPKIVITQDEITEYLNNYGSALAGSSDEQKKAQAVKTLKDQKIQEEVQNLVTDLRAKAKIIKYL